MAGQHGADAFNPHTAADLLRKAMYNRSEDDTHDHIGSISTTPSGIATPQPDPADKRLPGIIHSYFGQVGLRSHTESSAEQDPFFLAPKTMPLGDLLLQRFNIGAKGGLPTAPSSPKEDGDEVKHQGLSSITQELFDVSKHGPPKENAALKAYPTPPRSSTASASSSTQTDHETGSDITRAHGRKRKSSDGRPSTRRHLSAGDGITLRTRRSTAGPDPLQAVTTNPTIPASHISNPTIPRSPLPDASTNASQTFSAASTLVSCLENTKLTDDAVPPRKKSTPPRTPRTLSTDGSESARKRAALSTPRDSQSPARDGTLKSQQGSAPVNPPKGKLTVKIPEARGLRPSYYPYAVCVFEWNESIAKDGNSEGGVEMERDDSRGREDSGLALPMRRAGSEMGRSMAIPMKSRQSSTTSLKEQKTFKSGRQVTDPKWDHEGIFDVLGKQSSLDIFVYDRSHETFLGHAKVDVNVTDNNASHEGWYRLEKRNAEDDAVTGEIYLAISFQKTNKKAFGPEDFRITRLIGKGTFGQVYQVIKKDTRRVYAMKVLSKKVIVQKKEVAHTIGERNILVRTAMADSSFIVGLKFSFQTPTDLYLVTGFMSGGELFWHLQKEGRFNETRAKFYIAELILALQHLHAHDIVYRDLKPENILLDANGHVALCDFGLSKANLSKDATTNTFCGTTEYLAPEVLLDEQGYTTMVDFWSLGVLVFEMCCGWSPFYADDTQQMYKNIAFGKVRFPRDALSNDGRNFVKGLLNRNPKHRLGAKRDAEELKEHIFFADTDWNAMAKKMVTPPFKPKLKNVLDTQNFDPEFTNALENSSSLKARATALVAGQVTDSTPLSPGMQANFRGFTFVDESTLDEQFRGNDLERMEEDEEDHGFNWENALEKKESRGDRMSGIISTSDESGFMNGHFDM